MRWLDSITGSVDINLRKLWEIVEDRGAWHATVREVSKSWTLLSDRITTNSTVLLFQMFESEEVHRHFL